MKMYKLHQDVILDFITPGDKSFKFGYYNYQPISSDGSRLLAHKIDFEGRLPNPDEEVEVGYFDLNRKLWVHIAKTKAFNWQQGSMLQWLGPDFNSKIIFNDFENGQYISRIIDINTLQKTDISKAIYAVHPSGRFSISMNFERCDFTRAYSYNCQNDNRWEFIRPKDDHILIVDLINDNFKKIISLDDIIEMTGTKSYSDEHWFEHIMFNDNGERFAFYHRYTTVNGFFTNCITADFDGNNKWFFPLKDGERISHLGWKNSKEFVLFTYMKTSVQKLLLSNHKGKNKRDSLLIRIYRKTIKPLLPKNAVSNIMSANKVLPYYLMVEDKVGRSGKIEVNPKGMDGHPSFSKCGRFMLTDTYADDQNYRHLLIHDLSNHRTVRLGSFHSFYNSCYWRADLHPRFSSDENKVIIDVNYSGNTQIIVLDIRKVINDIKFH